MARYEIRYDPDEAEREYVILEAGTESELTWMCNFETDKADRKALQDMLDGYRGLIPATQLVCMLMPEDESIDLRDHCVIPVSRELRKEKPAQSYKIHRQKSYKDYVMVVSCLKDPSLENIIMLLDALTGAVPVPAMTGDGWDIEVERRDGLVLRIPTDAAYETAVDVCTTIRRWISPDKVDQEVRI